jgi:TRAP-type C4-dicarboxylate transport system permease small subunit
MIYASFPPRFKRISRIVDSLAFISFMGVLIWQGSWVGWNSMESLETAGGAFPIPLYPIKLLIPLVAILFIFQELANLIRGRD